MQHATTLTPATASCQLCCSPSGYAANGDGASACIPINTPQQLSFVLTAVGTCDATTIKSVKDSLYAYMTDPTTSFGVYTPNLILEVGCLETDSFQVRNIMPYQTLLC